VEGKDEATVNKFQKFQGKFIEEKFFELKFVMNLCHLRTERFLRVQESL
jgi:hypothetical protein